MGNNLWPQAQTHRRCHKHSTKVGADSVTSAHASAVSARGQRQPQKQSHTHAHTHKCEYARTHTVTLHGHRATDTYTDTDADTLTLAQIQTHMHTYTGTNTQTQKRTGQRKTQSRAQRHSDKHGHTHKQRATYWDSATFASQGHVGRGPWCAVGSSACGGPCCEGRVGQRGSCATCPNPLAAEASPGVVQRAAKELLVSASGGVACRAWAHCRVHSLMSWGVRSGSASVHRERRAPPQTWRDYLHDEQIDSVGFWGFFAIRH